MRIRDSRLAILDTCVVADLAKQDDTSRKVTSTKLQDLREERLLTTISGTGIAEACQSQNPNTRKSLVDTVVSRVDVYLQLQASDLLRMEIAEKDPVAVFGSQPLESPESLARLDVVTAPEIIEFARNGGLESSKVANLLPVLDSEIRKLEGIETFGEAVDRYELGQVKVLVERATAAGELRDPDMSEEALSAVLRRGKATRMFALMLIGNTYRRAKKWVDEKQQSKAAGALSDIRIAAEAAYCEAVFTTDSEFLAVGKLINEIVPTPVFRRW